MLNVSNHTSADQLGFLNVDAMCREVTDVFRNVVSWVSRIEWLIQKE
jgi:hypothetical protein